MSALSPIEMQMLEFCGYTTTKEGIINKAFKEIDNQRGNYGTIDIETAIDILNNNGLDTDDLSPEQYKHLMNITI